VFDVARQGYLGLLTGARSVGGDDGPMIEARQALLASGAYAPLRDAVARAAAGALTASAATTAGGAGVILDSGTGTGYYLAGALEAAPAAIGIGMDVSAAAVRAAARAHPRAAAVRWDVGRDWPIADGSVDAVLTVFAPRNLAQARRVLRRDGSLLLARPTQRHLRGLREALAGAGIDLVGVEAAKEDRLAESIAPHFATQQTHLIEHPLTLDAAQIAAAVLMGPSARHVEAARIADAARELAPVAAQASVLLSVYRPR